MIGIVGTLASLVGLGFSWRAWVQAKGARAAAIEATEAARTQEAAHELSGLAVDAKELLSAVQDGRKERAIALANDLAHTLSIAVSRRSSYIPVTPELEQRLKNLRAVSNDLAANGFPTDQKELSLLIRRCEQIHAKVCEVAGIVERRTEGGAE